MSAANGSVEVRAPAAQEEGTRSQVLRWLKAVGEPVAEHEPLIELETDKVTVEVAAPGAGVLTEILKAEQEEVAPGELLGRIGPAATAEPGRGKGRDTVSGGAGVSPSGASTAPPVRQPRQIAAASGTAAPASAPSRADATHRLSPAVRRLLAEHGLEAGTVRGTGGDGRITVADVMRAIEGSSGAGAATGSPAGEALVPQVQAPIEPSHRLPHTAVRKRIAARMVESLLHTAPHVTTVFEVDMSEVLAHRQRHRESFERQGVTLTLTAYFAQAAVAAVRAVPEANSRWTETALEVYDTVNLGVATAAEGGLVVPVLHHADSLDLLQTARRLQDLVRRAREGALAPADVRGGTLTLSNHGVSGSLLAAPIIIPQPQSAILGLGKLEKRAVVIEENGQERIAARSRCYATLTIDHRVMDGERANRFLQVFTERLAGWSS